MGYAINISIQELDEAGLDYHSLRAKLENEDIYSEIRDMNNQYIIRNVPITLHDLNPQGVLLICDTMWEFKAKRIIDYLRGEAIQHPSLRKIKKLEDLTI